MSRNITFTNARAKGEEALITNDYVVNAYWNHEVRLDEVPKRYINTISIIEDGEIIGTLNEQSEGYPNPGTFVVDYEKGLIQINPVDNITLVRISYWGTGSVWLAEDAQTATNSAKIIFTTTTEMNASTGNIGSEAICLDMIRQVWRWDPVLLVWAPIN